MTYATTDPDLVEVFHAWSALQRSDHGRHAAQHGAADPAAEH